MTSRAPKQWTLTKTETVTSFENWKQNLQYTLLQDSNFAIVLEPNVKWWKRNKTVANRCFQDDDERNYCGCIKKTHCGTESCAFRIDDAWANCKLLYFQSTWYNFLELADFKLENEERPEDLFGDQ